MGDIVLTIAELYQASEKVEKMSTPVENYDRPVSNSMPQQTSAASVIALGTAGIAIGIGGYLAVMLLGRSGWWSAPYVLSLLICGLAAIFLGSRSIIKSGKLSSGKILARIVGIISTVVGTLIVGMLGAVLLLMLMLSASM